MKRIDRAVKYRLKAAARWLPPAVQHRLARRRHLAHVSINLQQLTEPAFLGAAGRGTVGWITPTGLPDLPVAGFGIEPLSREQAERVEEWIQATNLDSDDMLERRLDNHNDELGRTRAALRTRLAVSRTARHQESSHAQVGGRILFDARSLQSTAFGQRGIGRFAAASLDGLRASCNDERIDLIVDPALEPLPSELTGSCQQVRWVDSARADDYALFIEPSPLTASPDPYLPVLSSSARRVAVVFDFIPLHYPDVYLSKAPDRAEYLARLDALRCFTDFLCISHLVAHEVSAQLQVPLDSTTVAWPRGVDQLVLDQRRPQASKAGPIVILTGDEARKNTFGALAAAGAATTHEKQRDVVVVGMAGHGTRVHHWSIAAMIRPGETTTVDRISDVELSDLLHRASVAVVASFDEGLSLPVIEAVHAGTPVVASDIPAHRELVGQGAFLAPPGELAALSRAIRQNRGRATTQAEQARRLRSHEHAILEDEIAGIVEATECGALPTTRVHRPSTDRLRVAICTPWPPQRTGIADFTAAVCHELSRLCDLTIVTTSGADVEQPLEQLSIDHVLVDPEAFRNRFDVIVVVIGNSHFHLPFLEALSWLDAVVIAHDTRMVEYYMALRSPNGLTRVMTTGQQDRSLTASLEDQIDDMRLLQNAGLWEIAQQARSLIMHSPSAAPRIESETGVPVSVLPFANYRSPGTTPITAQMRADARDRLGFEPDVIHLATFGYVDTRTKLVDLALEAAGWLQDWGQRIHFHIVGSAAEADARTLTARADELNLSGFTITGYAAEHVYRDYLLGIDCGVQLRVSPLLGVSGPLADLAAYGTPAVASRGLFVDVGSPSNVQALPDYVSPVLVAAALEEVLHDYPSDSLRESRRQEYLEAMSPSEYAHQLMEILKNERLGRLA